METIQQTLQRIDYNSILAPKKYWKIISKKNF